MKILKKIKLNAFWRWVDNFGYNYSIRRIIWQSKSCSWNWISIAYGIRRSDIPQIFPVWNMSNNSSRSLLFGFTFWYFQFTYHRKKSFNQKRKLIFRKKLWKFYQLFF